MIACSCRRWDDVSHLHCNAIVSRSFCSRVVFRLLDDWLHAIIKTLPSPPLPDVAAMVNAVLKLELPTIIPTSDDARDGEQQTERRYCDRRSYENVHSEASNKWACIARVACGDVGTVDSDKATAMDGVEPTDEGSLSHVDAERVRHFRFQMRRGEWAHVRLDEYLANWRVLISPILAISHAIFAVDDEAEDRWLWEDMECDWWRLYGSR